MDLKLKILKFPYSSFLCHKEDIVFFWKDNLTFAKYDDKKFSFSPKIPLKEGALRMRHSGAYALIFFEREIQIVDITAKEIVKTIDTQDRILDADMLNNNVLISTPNKVVLIDISSGDEVVVDESSEEDVNFGAVCFLRGSPVYWKNGAIYKDGIVMYEGVIPETKIVPNSDFLCFTTGTGIRIKDFDINLESVKGVKSAGNKIFVWGSRRVDIFTYDHQQKDILPRRVKFFEKEIKDVDKVKGRILCGFGKGVAVIKDSKFDRVLSVKLETEESTPPENSPTQEEESTPSENSPKEGPVAPSFRHGNVYTFGSLSSSRAEDDLLRLLKRWYPKKVILREYPIGCNSVLHPKDFIIDNIVIEFDGPQHFATNRHEKDIRFTCCAIKEGYNVIRIHKLESTTTSILKRLIDNMTNTKPKIFFVGVLYEGYMMLALEKCPGTEVVHYSV